MALEKRRLKISTIEDLNDPFEFGLHTIRDRSQRRMWREVINYTFERNGLISFSDNWNSPLMWSHYADSHKGLALGFDVKIGDYLKKVIYVSERELLPKVTDFNKDQMVSKIDKATYTKFDHWQYEQEYRTFVNLDEKDGETNLYFLDFGPETVLKEIVLGPKCVLTSRDLRKKTSGSVKFTTARLAFQTFEVVPQKNRKLQK